MSEEQGKPFEVVGDEALEARIVAWALGEVSEFEVGELTRLCEERPELEVFRRRMVAVHGLAGEGLKKPETDWKLPPAKRQKVLHAIGGRSLEARRERSSRFAARRMLLVAAACLVMTVVVAGLMTPAMLRAKKGGVVSETYSAPREGGEAAVDVDSRGEKAPASDPMVDYSMSRPEVTKLKPAAPSGSANRERLRRSSGARMSVEVPDVPATPGEPAGLVTEAKKSQALSFAGRAIVDRTQKMVPLGTDLPKERIEGTPKKVELPGLADVKPARPPVVNQPVPKPMKRAAPAAGPAPVADSVFADEAALEERRIVLSDGSKTAEEFGFYSRAGAERGGSGGGGGMAGGGPRLGDVPVSGALFRSDEVKVARDAIAGRSKHTTDSDHAEPANEVKALTGLASGNRSADAIIERSDVDKLGVMPEEEAKRAGDGFQTHFGAPVVDGRRGKESGLTKELAKKRDGQSRQIVDGTDIAWSEGDGDSTVAADSFAADDSGSALRLRESGTTRGMALTGKDDPVRSNAAERDKKAGQVDELRRNLHMAEGNLDLGRFDEAKRKYEKALRVDPYNKAARQGLERVASETSDYYRAAYDHTRAKLSAEVDTAWELEGAENGKAGKEAQKGAKQIAELRGGNRWWKDHDGKEAKDKTGALAGNASGDEWGWQARPGAVDGEVTWGTKSEEREALATKGRESNGRAAGQGEAAGEGMFGLGLGAQQAPGASVGFSGNGVAIAGGTVTASGVVVPTTGEPESAVKKLQAQMMAEDQLAGEAEIEVVREFIHPGEYEPPELPNQPGGEGLGELAQFKTRNVERHGLLVDAPEDVSEGLQLSIDSLPETPGTDEAIDLMAEMSAEDEPFSTFSLHVSDASFRVAAAALERGERPDPEAVRPEEYYNAFDYGDPAPTAGEPVACAIEQCAHPLLPSRNLVRVGVRTAAAGRGAGQPLRLTVLLDNSGSMEREDRRAAVQAAMEQLATLLGPQDVVTVVGFARQPRLLCDRVSGDGVKAQLEGLVEKTPAEGGTNLEQALALADELAMRQFDQAAQNRIVLLTDGAANLGNADPEDLAKRIEGLRQKGVSFDAAGFGTAGMNDRMLERLTRDGNGRYYVVDGPEDADEQFAKKLAGAFRPAAENVKVQVRFNPARVGGYRLIGFEEHRLKKEDFRDDTVDAAEMASEEAGVAVYQVELLPDGEGEIGEVSVRFRDASKGKMVERSWTMPHDESAPGFDRAPASMQVAGLAVLAADALRDGPLAPLTDWGELAPVSNQVRAEFGGSEKVGQLLRMVERLRE